MNVKNLLVELEVKLNSIRGSIKIDVMTGGSFEVADMIIEDTLEIIKKAKIEVKE